MLNFESIMQTFFVLVDVVDFSYSSKEKQSLTQFLFFGIEDIATLNTSTCLDYIHTV